MYYVSIETEKHYHTYLYMTGKKIMKRITKILITTSIIIVTGIASTMGMLFISKLAHSNNNQTIATESEKPHLYYKHWFATAHQYQATITVRSDEYDLEKTFFLNGENAKQMESYKKGDMINAELFTWKIDSNDTIVKRSINKLEP